MPRYPSSAHTRARVCVLKVCMQRGYFSALALFNVRSKPSLPKKNSTSSSLLVLPLSFSPASCGRSTSLCRVFLLLFSMRAGRLNRSDGTAAVWLRIMFWPAQFPPPFYTKKKRKEQHTRAGADTSFARRRDTGVRKSKTKKREKDSSTKQAGKEHTTTQLLSAPPLMIRAALVTHGVTIKTRE